MFDCICNLCFSLSILFSFQSDINYRHSSRIFVFTVPTTCSRPSIEMVGFMYLLLCRLLVVGPVLKWLALCIYLLLCRLLVVGPVLKWLALLLCRLLVVGPVLKWLALFIYLFIYFSVFTPLTRPLYIISSNLACSSV